MTAAATALRIALEAAVRRGLRPARGVVGYGVEWVDDAKVWIPARRNTGRICVVGALLLQVRWSAGIFDGGALWTATVALGVASEWMAQLVAGWDGAPSRGYGFRDGHEAGRVLAAQFIRGK